MAASSECKNVLIPALTLIFYVAAACKRYITVRFLEIEIEVGIFFLLSK